MKNAGKVVRKVIGVGECDAVILPREYLKAHNLKRGDHVEVAYNNVIRITPIRPEEIERELRGASHA